MATQQTLLQVSQSASGDLFDKHASLAKFWLLYFFQYSCRTKRKMSKHSELYNWLKSLPGGFQLERCSKEFESRGFQPLSSLKYLQPGDIEAFFPSPENFLLAEKRILASKIKAFVDSENRRTPMKSVELSQRFNT